ncbi:PREDICTED: uncharacterized protein LOC105314127 [Amphimedon queenslandica]|uniref:Cadherin domain-containing protein n=2 Tax=Amphimedon queenslandica TaxID=400682 RepID=A0AAN0IQ68_AMPQE|nr:PREDICTED: uncharacterized protein LOC105314127 [Amphimedon queenslandica]|eukprot:XP_011406397.1 PREDICTED: uncharacterized protein LOC105314127 [Amphimedon queenslandica]
MSVKKTFEMVSLCFLVLLMQPSFVSTFGCQHNSCSERISHSYAYNAVKVANESETEYENFTFPVNATVYATASSNASFYASIPKDYSNHCRLRTFESDCWASKQCHGPNRKILLYEEERQKVIEYKFYNLTVAQDGTRIDICAHCGGPGGSYVCFPPVYLTVNGPPVNLSNYVSVKVTSHGIMITGIIDTDTELLIIIKNTNNETVYEETVHTLPFVVSGYEIGSNFDPAANYTVVITGKNPAGTGETLQHNVSFKNFISFNVSSVNLGIVDDQAEAIINLTFNRSRPLSIPQKIKVESDCMHKGHKNVILNKSNSLRIPLLRGTKNCVLKLSSGGKQESINISLQIIQNLSISSCNGGYFEIKAKLLPGATGIVMRVLDSQKNLSFRQEIKCDDEGLIVANSSEKLEPGNYTVEIHYLNGDRTIDNSSTNYFNLSCSTDDVLSTTDPPSTNIPVTSIVIVCVITAIVATIVIIVVIIVLIKIKSKKSKYTVSDKGVTYSAKDVTIVIEDLEQQKSETEVDIPAPHSVPVRDTESHSESRPHPPRNYPKPENSPAPDTPANTDASTKPLLDKGGGSTMASSTMTSQQSASVSEKQPLIPDSKNDEKAKFVTPEIKVPPQLRHQKEPENSLQNPPSSSTVLIPKAPTNNRPEEKKVTLAPPVLRVVPPANNQNQEINQDSEEGQLSYILSRAIGSSTTYRSLAAGNKSGDEKKGQ